MEHSKQMANCITCCVVFLIEMVSSQTQKQQEPALPKPYIQELTSKPEGCH